MTTFDWPNNYSKSSGSDCGLSIEQKLSNGVFLLFLIQHKNGRPHLEFPRSFHEREEDLAGTAKRELRKRDMFVSKISSSVTLADNRNEMYHD